MAHPTLFIAGAGHIGRAVADLAVWLGHNVVLWDDRTDVLAEAPETIQRISAPIGEAVVAVGIGPETAVVVVTRNVDVDCEILPVLLATGAYYVGLMGSSRRWATAQDLLSERGVSAADLRRISSPVGIEIHAETPEEIAVSILSEITGHRGP